MAGRIRVRVIEHKLNGSMSFIPLTCPAHPDYSSTGPMCTSSAGDDMVIRACPFMYASEGVLEGMITRHTDLTALYDDARFYAGDRNQIRILCLRQESKDTPPGI